MFAIGGSAGVSVPNRSHTNERIIRADGLALGRAANAGHRDHVVDAAAVSWGDGRSRATNEGFAARFVGLANNTQGNPALIGVRTTYTTCNRCPALPVDANQIRITGLVSGFAHTADGCGLDALSFEAAPKPERAVVVDGAT